MEVKDDQFEQESGTQDGLRVFRAERVERSRSGKCFQIGSCPNKEKERDVGKREEGWDLAGLRSTNQKARIFKGDQ